jgi:hypothetical protein
MGAVWGSSRLQPALNGDAEAQQLWLNSPNTNVGWTLSASTYDWNMIAGFNETAAGPDGTLWSISKSFNGTTSTP